MSWLQAGGSAQPGPCLTRGGQPLLSRASRVHGAVTEQGPGLGPALSPAWHVGRAQPQEARRVLVRGASLGPPTPTSPALPACPRPTQGSKQVPCLSGPTSHHLRGRTEWPEPNFVRSTSKAVPEHLGPLVSPLSVTRSTPFFLPQPQSGGITSPLSSDTAKSSKRGPALPPPPGAPQGPRDKVRAHPGWAPFTEGEMLESFPGARPPGPSVCLPFTPAG